jgi:hypothetical protein
MTIDYTKLNDRIVKQAYAYILSKDEKRKLIEEKLERAVQYRQSLEKTVHLQIEE